MLFKCISSFSNIHAKNLWFNMWWLNYSQTGPVCFWNTMLYSAKWKSMNTILNYSQGIVALLDKTNLMWNEWATSLGSRDLYSTNYLIGSGELIKSAHIFFIPTVKCLELDLEILKFSTFLWWRSCSKDFNFCTTVYQLYWYMQTIHVHVQDFTWIITFK